MAVKLDDVNLLLSTSQTDKFAPQAVGAVYGLYTDC